MTSNKVMAQSELKLSDEWDKTFTKSDKVEHKKSPLTTVMVLP